MNNNILGISLALLSTFFYSLMDLSIKWLSIHNTIDHGVLYFQSTLVMLIIISIAGFFVLGKKLLQLKTKKSILLLRGSLSFVNFYLGFYILGLLPLDIYYSIIFFAPSMAAIMAVFLLKEKVNIFSILALVLGLLGIFIITNPFSESFNITLLFPMLLTILLAFTVASTGVITRKYLPNENPISLTIYIFIISSILGLIASIFTTSVKETFTIDYDSVPLIIAIAVFCILGILLFIRAYQITPIQIVAPTEYALIIWGIILGYIAFTHTPTVTTLVGASVIIISNVISGIGSKKS